MKRNDPADQSVAHIRLLARQRRETVTLLMAVAIASGGCATTAVQPVSQAESGVPDLDAIDPRTGLTLKPNRIVMASAQSGCDMRGIGLRPVLVRAAWQTGSNHADALWAFRCEPGQATPSQADSLAEELR